jgi:hypothetical protein
LIDQDQPFVTEIAIEEKKDLSKHSEKDQEWENLPAAGAWRR